MSGTLFFSPSLPGFLPRSQACCLARPKGSNYHLVHLEERNLCVEKKNPKPFAPGVDLGISSHVCPILRLRNLHDSNNARLFLDWAPRLAHAEDP